MQPSFELLSVKNKNAKLAVQYNTLYFFWARLSATWGDFFSPILKLNYSTTMTTAPQNVCAWPWRFI